MKATNKINETAPETQIAVQEKSGKKDVRLLSDEDIQKIFLNYDKKVKETVEDAKTIVVNDGDSLVIAENKASGVSGLIKMIDDVRKKVADPYLRTKKEIDAKAKTYIEPLENAKVLYNSRILAFKQLQQAQKSLEAEKDQEKILREDEAKTEEASRIIRIKRMINAKLLGGSYTTKDGKVKTSPGCQKPMDCDIVLAEVDKNFPDPETFVYMKEEVAKAKAEIEAEILLVKADLIKMNSGSEKQRVSAFESISTKRVEESVKLKQDEEKIRKNIAKETSKQIETVQSEVSEAGKGIRRTVTYELIDTDKVPSDYLQLNTAKIEEYKNLNLEKIKDALKRSDDEGETFIPGIKFKYQESYTNR